MNKVLVYLTMNESNPLGWSRDNKTVVSSRIRFSATTILHT